MIKFQNVSKSFGNNQVLKTINLEVNDSEIFGIIGESGAGKSTLLKLVNQLEKQDTGTLEVNGVNIKSLSKEELRIFRKDIAVVFQDYNLLKNKTVFENIALPLDLMHKRDEDAVLKVLGYVGMVNKKNAYPNSLSGGERQRVAIARALITEPKILLCDEPTSALDQKTTDYILTVLKDINQQFGTTILVVTHELNVAKSICDTVAILEEGSLKEIVRVNNNHVVHQESYVEYAKKVLES